MPLQKPPIGLKPKYIADRERLCDIKQAIIRYAEKFEAIPIEWITEYNELQNQINKNYL